MTFAAWILDSLDQIPTHEERIKYFQGRHEQRLREKSNIRNEIATLKQRLEELERKL